MSFDRLAPHYRWMEWLLAGSKLQRCRTAFLPQIPPPREALLLGEGNGRFLLEFCRAFPQTRITCVDASARMLECARRRVEVNACDLSRVKFIKADLLDWTPGENRYDLIVSHFFLDCFPPPQLAQVVSKISTTATDDARWLLADFHEPGGGWAKWRARWILQTMYFYFRWTTKLAAKHLVRPDDYLHKAGFALEQRRFSEWGLLHSDLWKRCAT